MRSKRSRRTARRCRNSVGTFAILVNLVIACLPAQGADRSVDAGLIKVIAEREVADGRLQLTSRTCLGLERGSDPSRQLLRELSAAGLTFRKASACLSPPNGILFTVSPATNAAGSQLKVQVEIGDMTIAEGSHFATLLSRGIYTVVKDAESVWRVVDHQAIEVK